MERGIDKAVRLAGNQTALGLRIGVTPQAVQKWVAQGYPSPDGCKQIALAFPNQITREELDPYLFGDAPVRMAASKESA